MSLISAPKTALGISKRLAKVPVDVALGAAGALRSRAAGGNEFAEAERVRAERLREEAERTEAEAQRELDEDERMVAAAVARTREENEVRGDVAKLEKLAVEEEKLEAEEAALKAEKEAKRLQEAAAEAKQARKNGTS